MRPRQVTRHYPIFIINISPIHPCQTNTFLLLLLQIYLDPYFDLPSGKSIRTDTESMEKGIKETSNALDQVSLSTHDLIKGLEAHAGNVSNSLSEMSTLLNNLRESDDKRR